MKVENNKRLSIRKVIIIFGTKCNLKCRHCMMGDPEPMAIKPEHIDALIDNVKFINKLLLTGGEATCHVDEIKMILDKFANSDVRIDHIGVNTNCFEFSEELANSINDFNEKHTLEPKKAKFQYSPDRFHFEAGLTKERLEENLKKYKSILKDFLFIDNDISDGIDITGRAKSLKKDEIDFRKNISVAIPDGILKLEIENNYVDKGEITLCPNGCVYSWDSTASCGIVNNDYRYSIGNILEAPLFDLIYQYNEKHKDDNDFTHLIFHSSYDPVFLALKILYDMAPIKKDIIYAIESNDQKRYNDNIKRIYSQLEAANAYANSILKEQKSTRVQLVLKGYKIFDGYSQMQLYSGKEKKKEDFYAAIANGMILDYANLSQLADKYFKEKDEKTKKRIFDICNANTQLEFVQQDTIVKMFECYNRFDVDGYVKRYREMISQMEGKF